MKKVVVYMLFMLVGTSAFAGGKNWTNGNGTYLWSDAGNWSGGVPGTGDDAKFKSSATDSCYVDIPIDIKSIIMESDYTGTIKVANGISFIVNSSGFTQQDGVFIGGNDTMHINGDFSLTGGVYHSTSGIASFEDKYSTNGGRFLHNNGTLKFIGSTKGVECFGADTFFNVLIEKTDDGKVFDLRSSDTVKVVNKLKAVSGDIDGGGIVMIWDSLQIQNSFDEWKDAQIIFGGTGGKFVLDQLVFEPENDLVVMLNAASDTMEMQTSMDSTEFGNTSVNFVMNSGVFKHNSSNKLKMNWNAIEIFSNATWIPGTGVTEVDQDITNTGGKIRNQGAGTLDIRYNNTLNLDVEDGDAVYHLDIHMGDKKDLIIAAGDTLIAKGNLTYYNGEVYTGVLEAWGDVTVKAAFDGGDAPLKFGGPNTQTWDMSEDNEVFKANVILHKETTEYVNLTSTVKLRESGSIVRLDKGYFHTTDTTLLWLDFGVSASWGSDSSFVDGPLRAEGRNAFSFSVGKNKVFAPLAVTNISNKNSHWTVEYQPYNPDDDGYDRSLREPTIDYVCNREFWTVERGNGNPSASIQLFWDYPKRSCHVAHPDDMKVLRWDGPNNQWVDHGNGGTTGDSISGSVVTAGDLNNFTIPFALGGGPPPVILSDKYLQFEAELQGAQVQLDWSITQEIAIEEYVIQRSTNGHFFEDRMTVQGNDYASKHSYFMAIDEQPFYGHSYYRLKLLDLNGQIDYSPIRAIDNSFFRANPLQVYPNPTAGNFHLDIEEGLELQMVELINHLGQRIPIPKQATNDRLSFEGSLLPPGMYMLNINYNQQSTALPIMIKR